MRGDGWTGMIALAFVTLACGSMEDAASVNREIRDRYGVEETSIHVNRSEGPTVVTIEVVDPDAEDGEDVQERIRGMASLAAEELSLAGTDSVVVALSSDGEESRATLTHRFAVGELDPDRR